MSVFDDLIRKGRLFQTIQHKKKISEQASACTQREDKQLKYQKKSIAGELVCKLSGVQSSRQSFQAEAIVAQRSEFVLYS